MSSGTEIRPFRVDMPDDAIDGLRRRIAATRWPCRELVADRSQGVQLATITELARYWAADQAHGSAATTTGGHSELRLTSQPSSSRTCDLGGATR